MPGDPVNPADPSGPSLGLTTLRDLLRTRGGALQALEMALVLLMFISYTVSASPFMAAPLVLIIVNLSFLIANLSKGGGYTPPTKWLCADLVRSVSSAIIFLIVSCTTAAQSREGGLAAAAVFGFLLTGVLIYDVYHTYRTLLSAQETPTQGRGESESSNLDVE
ncbi:CKLF-like MARVEL transmembrane domain-containing protein 5 isoform X2 [Chiloscyllium punctatum]